MSRNVGNHYSSNSKVNPFQNNNNFNNNNKPYWPQQEFKNGNVLNIANSVNNVNNNNNKFNKNYGSMNGKGSSGGLF